jgi:hypothetical protein
MDPTIVWSHGDGLNESESFSSSYIRQAEQLPTVHHHYFSHSTIHNAPGCLPKRSNHDLCCAIC